VQDFKADNLWFAGTENGLFISIDKGENWTRFTNEYPNVSTYDMKLHPIESDLIIGTFGRAAYIIDNIDPLRKAAMTVNAVFSDSLSVFDVPTAYLSEMRTPTGIRFDADGMFSGENKSFSASIPYHVLGVNEDKPTDTLFIHVVNSMGDTVRSIYDIPRNNGLNYGSWWLDYKGFQTPSREWEELKREPGISYVSPGVYDIHLGFGNHSVQTEVEVEPLPDMPYNSETYQSLTNYIREVQQLSEMTIEQIKRLTKSSDILSDIQKQTAINRDTAYASQIDSLKTFADSTQKVLNGILDEIDYIDERDGYTPEQDDFVSAFYTAYSACYDFTAPNQTDRNSLNYAREKWEEIQPMIDDFYKNEWAELKRLWSETQWSPFEN
jgi:hypothetical protein